MLEKIISIQVIVLFLCNFSTSYGFDLTSPQYQSEDVQNSISESKNKSNDAESKRIQEDSEKLSNEAEAYMNKIKEAVEINDYAWIATQFKYPVCVEMNCRETEIKTPKELLKFKEKIFTDNIKKIILNQDSSHLFEREESFMIGDGEIWFEPGNIHRIANDEGYSIIYCSSNETKPLPKKYYGTWEVYRTKIVGGSMSQAAIKASIGKYFYVTENSFINKTKILESNLTNVEWLETENTYTDHDDGYPECSLLWYDLPEAINDKQVMIYACSGGQKHLYLEITNQDELSCYLDGYFIFMRKIK